MKVLEKNYGTMFGRTNWTIYYCPHCNTPIARPLSEEVCHWCKKEIVWPNGKGFSIIK